VEPTDQNKNDTSEVKSTPERQKTDPQPTGSAGPGPGTSHAAAGSPASAPGGEPAKAEGIKPDPLRAETRKSDSAKSSESVASPGRSGGGSPPAPPVGKKSSAPGRGLAGLALLVALAALGLSGWQWYQDQATADQTAALDQRFDDISAAQRRSNDESRQALQQRLENVASSDQLQQIERLATEVQRSQQALSQRLDALEGDARSNWKLAEAEYLLRLASLRLLATQDVRSATELLDAVGQILQSEPDSGVFGVREQLAQVQSQLQALPEIDRPGIYLRLAALRDQVDRIVALPVPVFDPDQVSVEEESEDQLAQRTWADRMLMRLERYVRVDFQRGKVITPLLDEAEMHRVRRTLQLTLEQAQWAALRGEEGIYQQSLEQADAVLRQFFELDNPQVNALQEQIERLAEEPVALTPPDLSALQQSLAAYIQSRDGSATASETGTQDSEAGNE